MHLSRRKQLISLAFILPAFAAAQTIRPGAGQLLRDITPPPSLPSTSLAPSVTTTPDAPAATSAPADTTPISVKTIVITGNTVLATAELHVLVAKVEGTTVTLTELRAHAERITQAYVARGYLLARAYLPAQEIKADGVVTIAIQEGRLGEAKLDNSSLVAAPVVRRFLAPLATGAVVDGAQIEDVLMRLREVPGLQTASLLHPGAAAGTADLVVTATPGKRVSGSVTLDNSGGDTSGAIRLGALAEVASPLGQGDRLTLQGLTTMPAHESMRYGRAAYDYALGGKGLRVGASYSHLAYELGQNFANLDAHGTADVAQLWVSRPLLRIREAIVDTRLGYDYRNLDDRVDSSDTRTARHLHSIIAGVTGGLRDGLLGGGYTSAGLTGTFTQVDIYDEAAREADAGGLGTQGGAAFLKLQVQRLQNLPAGFTLELNASGQLASGNLDTGDQFGAAGPDGVRAFPQGEQFGDQGLLFTTELRHALPLPRATGNWQGVVFYDQSTIWTAREPVVSGSDNRRTLGGVGAGLRWSYRQNWTARVDAAWRTQGGAPVVAGSHHPQIWASLSYAF
jgi:hemolysin activation/secretion protein